MERNMRIDAYRHDAWLPTTKKEVESRGWDSPDVILFSGDAYVDLLVAIRGEARAAGNFPLSDRIRDGLKKLGVEVNDREGGTTWARS